PYNSWGPTSQSVGGGADHTNDLQVDGSPTGVGVKNSYQPIMDSVEEVNVQQNSVDAEYGHSSGSAITMTTKSGTNEFHGLAYYQGQYPWANAQENRLFQTINLDRKNIYGGTFGNPILKNKLFNFAAFEGWKYTQPGSFVETVPTTPERAGDYSQSLNGSGGLRTIYDPSSQVANGANGVTRTPFPGNVIPASRIDPIAAKYTSQLWPANAPGIGPYHDNNYAIALPVSYPYKNFSDRVDYNVSDKLRIYGRVGLIRTPAATSNPTGSPLFENDRGSTRNATQVTGNVTYTLNPTTVVNIRGDYHSFVDASNFVQAAGAPTFATIWPNQNFYAPVYADS
ncbi:MAG: carboxypeptidase-like regulatory domain-containing protein, partial [Bryobacteraceae bacterium]